MCADNNNNPIDIDEEKVDDGSESSIEGDYDTVLYKDCKKNFYAPENELDLEFFTLLITSPLLQNKNIHYICKKMSIKDSISRFLNPTQSFVGHIYLETIKYIKCNECELYLPFDLDFYSNITQKELKKYMYNNNSAVSNNDIENNDTCKKNIYNICPLCYEYDNLDQEIQKHTLNKVNMSTGLGNICDWIYLFTTKHEYEEYGRKCTDYNDFYCNLNKNSEHYKRFAKNYYFCGESFNMIEETSLKQIIQEYC